MHCIASYNIHLYILYCHFYIYNLHHLLLLITYSICASPFLIYNDIAYFCFCFFYFFFFQAEDGIRDAHYCLEFRLVLFRSANTAASRALVMDMVATGVIEPTLAATSPRQLMDALRRGDISVGVVVPPDFERRRFDGREAVQVLVDGSDTVVQA